MLIANTVTSNYAKTDTSQVSCFFVCYQNWTLILFHKFALHNVLRHGLLIYLTYFFFFHTYDSIYMSKANIWTLKICLLIEQCLGHSSRCDHTSWFLPLELQRVGVSPHSKWKFSWGWTRATDYQINVQESYHWAILTLILAKTLFWLKVNFAWLDHMSSLLKDFSSRR